MIATRHLVAQSPAIFAGLAARFRTGSGLLGQTGVRDRRRSSAVCSTRVRPAAVIAVDALAAGRLSRLLRTVQLADTGITPVAGVGKRPRSAQQGNTRRASYRRWRADRGGRCNART